MKSNYRAFSELESVSAKREDERLKLERELKRIQQLEHAESQRRQRPRDQSISDMLLGYHRRGIELLHRRVENDEQRAKWKQEWKQFLAELWDDMKRHNCSDSEIHRIKYPGGGSVTSFAFTNTYPQANNLKSTLKAQLEEILSVADLHDTTRPTP